MENLEKSESFLSETSVIKVETEEEVSIIDIAPDVECDVSINEDEQYFLDEENTMPCLTNNLLLEKKQNMKRYLCTLCDISFYQEHVYMKHLESHTEAYVCTPCNKVFKIKRYYNRHMQGKRHLIKITEDSKPAIDTVSDDSLTSSNLPAKQKRYRGPKRVYKCTLCEKIFYQKEFLIRHMNSHLGIKPEICSTCGKRFNEKSVLKRHNMRVHMKLKSFVCDVCKKAFAWRSVLLNHMLLHTGSKAHICEQCGRRFRRKSQLDLHSRTHSILKNYLCMYCGKQYNTRQRVEVHENLAHLESEVRECNLCQMKFDSEDNLDEHNLLIHQEKRNGLKDVNSSSRNNKNNVYCCSYCGKQCSSHRNVIIHERIHTKEKPYTCKLCEKSFTQSNQLSTHIRSHEGLKPYVCSVCNKGYSTKSNLVQHYEVHGHTKKRFSCDHCTKTFLYQSILKRHMKSHPSKEDSQMKKEVGKLRTKFKWVK